MMSRTVWTALLAALLMFPACPFSFSGDDDDDAASDTGTGTTTAGTDTGTDTGSTTGGTTGTTGTGTSGGDDDDDNATTTSGTGGTGTSGDDDDDDDNGTGTTTSGTGDTGDTSGTDGTDTSTDGPECPPTLPRCGPDEIDLGMIDIGNGCMIRYCEPNTCGEAFPCAEGLKRVILGTDASGCALIDCAPDDTTTACKTVSDCGVVQKSCCGQCSVDTLWAVNKNSDWAQQQILQCALVLCPTGCDPNFIAEREALLTCENGQCGFIERSCPVYANCPPGLTMIQTGTDASNCPIMECVPSETTTACNATSDCVAVHSSCCGECDIDNVWAVNKNSVWLAELNDQCARVDCASICDANFLDARSKYLTCEAGECTFKVDCPPPPPCAAGSTVTTDTDPVTGCTVWTCGPPTCDTNPLFCEP
jgi:hypothetical protein